MCLQVPGKITKIDGDTASVEYGDEVRPGKIIDGGYSVGDYVVLQGGVVAMKIPRKEAEEALKLYKEAVE